MYYPSDHYVIRIFSYVHSIITRYVKDGLELLQLLLLIKTDNDCKLRVSLRVTR